MSGLMKNERGIYTAARIDEDGDASASAYTVGTDDVCGWSARMYEREPDDENPDVRVTCTVDVRRGSNASICVRVHESTPERAASKASSVLLSIGGVDSAPKGPDLHDLAVSMGEMLAKKAAWADRARREENPYAEVETKELGRLVTAQPPLPPAKLTFAAEELGRRTGFAPAARAAALMWHVNSLSPLVREGAVRGLEHVIDTPGVIDALRDKLTREESPGVRAVIEEVLTAAEEDFGGAV